MKNTNKINMLHKFNRFAALTLGLLLLLSMGCAHTVKINSTPPGALVVVDGKKVGHTPTRFKEDPWPGEHVIRVSARGYQPRVIHVARKNINWWWFAAGLGGCALCSGPGCLAGASLANLSLCPACAGCLLTGNFGAMISILGAPSLCSIPAMGLGGLLGSTPLGFLALADQSPDKILVRLKPLDGYEAAPQGPVPPAGPQAPATQNSDAPPSSPAPAQAPEQVDPEVEDPGPTLSY